MGGRRWPKVAEIVVLSPRSQKRGGLQFTRCDVLLFVCLFVRLSTVKFVKSFAIRDSTWRGLVVLTAIHLFVTNLVIWRAAGDEQHDNAVQMSRRVWIVFDEDLLEVAGRHAHRRRTDLSELRRRRGSSVAPSPRFQTATPISGRAYRKN